jgi:hypothetical protein
MLGALAPDDPPFEPFDMDLLPNAYPLKRFHTVALPWLCDKIEKHSQIPQGCFDPVTKEPWDYRLWVMWAVRHGFVYLWPDPPTIGIIARPVSRKCFEECPKGQELYCFDQDGDGLYVDFLWAPSQMNIVAKFLKQTGKRIGGWEHRTTGKMHIIPIHKLLLMLKCCHADEVLL